MQYSLDDLYDMEQAHADETPHVTGYERLVRSVCAEQLVLYYRLMGWTGRRFVGLGRHLMTVAENAKQIQQGRYAEMA